MIVAQCLSIPFERPFHWRYVQLVGVGIAVSLMVASFFMNRSGKSSGSGDSEESRLLLDQGMLL